MFKTDRCQEERKVGIKQTNKCKEGTARSRERRCGDGQGCVLINDSFSDHLRAHTSCNNRGGLNLGGHPRMRGVGWEGPMAVFWVIQTRSQAKMLRAGRG